MESRNGSMRMAKLERKEARLDKSQYECRMRSVQSAQHIYWGILQRLHNERGRRSPESQARIRALYDAATEVKFGVLELALVNKMTDRICALLAAFEAVEDVDWADFGGARFFADELTPLWAGFERGLPPLGPKMAR